jgi:hypothetical protein
MKPELFAIEKLTKSRAPVRITVLLSLFEFTHVH